ncbi:inositol-trisphosphate 3-kinase B-like isoform X1 [Clytia hemisphaerica]|uniref:Kinase n=1 Tax=Clytia hemisphaerica TaxID=252671 RepID=A0A7M5WZ29_9CNID
METPHIVISKDSPNIKTKFDRGELRCSTTHHHTQSVVDHFDVGITSLKNSLNNNKDRITFGSNTIHYMDSNSNLVEALHFTDSAPRKTSLESPSSDSEPMNGGWSAERQLSTCSLSSVDFTSDYSDNDDNASTTVDDDIAASRTSMWVKLRKAVRWSPFMQSYTKKNYRWIQLAGHSGGFKPGENGAIMKKSSKREVDCLKSLMKDPLKSYVPEFKRQTMEGEDLFIEMQDLLAEFDHPAFVMDCKIGVRTYLEDEVKKNPKPREDLYLKMIAVDPNEPTEEENATCSCTKERYMQFREKMSSTTGLGFRIEGIKRGENNPDKDFKKLKSEEDIASVIRRFTENKKDIQAKYMQRLREIKKALAESPFFQSHELIGSSLLFVHDTKGKVGVWLIDFGKTVPLTNGMVIDHKSPWSLGNHEDGYLIGLENIMKIFGDLEQKSKS